jgi:DNA modification methylase
VIRILHGDCRALLPTLPDGSVHCCVTSPPYFGLRDYGHAEQIGLEPTPDEFVAALVDVFREVRRVLRDDGTLWLNLGDSYAGSRGSGAPSANSTLAGNGHQGGGPKLRAMTESRRRDDVAIPRSDIRVAGLKPKDLIGIPWRVAFALQADGWYLRQDIIWHKPNPMPESVQDRCTKAHEYVFLLSKSATYYCDMEAIAEPAIGPAGGNVKPTRSFEHDPVKHRTKAGLAAAQARAREAGGYETRNKRSVWTIVTQPYSEAHFATMAPELAENCIKAGCPIGGTVLDPFGGAGTTGLVADRLQRSAILVELNATYADMARTRVTDDAPLFAEVAP